MSQTVQTAIGNPRPLYIGESMEDCEALISCVLAKWHPVPQIGAAPKQATVQGKIPPDAWKTFHKWYEGEFHFKDLGEAYRAFFKNGAAQKAYIITEGDNLPIPHCILVNKDAQGKQWMWIFKNLRPTDVPMQIQENKDVLWVIPFVFDSVTIIEGGQMLGFEWIDSEHNFEEGFERYGAP